MRLRVDRIVELIGEHGAELVVVRPPDSVMRVLELVYLVLRLPAWSVNLTSRVTKRPKLHLVDTGLAAHLLGMTPERFAEPTAPGRSA
jgi:hypothetical protein